MKNRTLIIGLFLLFALPIFGQQKASSEEAAVQKVIEDETKYFNQRNFDKWAECVAHDDMAYFSYISPFHGERAVYEAHGWDEISKSTKAYMEKWPPNDNLPTKTDYKFKITGNMAFVTFMENNSIAESRVLEKKDGQWRILRMDAVNSGAFENFHQLYALHRMAGSWEMDMSTHKIEGGGSWKLIGSSIQFEATPMGLAYTQKDRFRNQAGELRTNDDRGMMSLHMGTGKIGLFSAIQYPNSGWTEAYLGTGSFDEDGVLRFEGTAAGGSNVFEGQFNFEGDLLAYSLVAKDEKGEEIMSTSHKFTRKGMHPKP